MERNIVPKVIKASHVQVNWSAMAAHPCLFDPMLPFQAFRKAHMVDGLHFPRPMDH